VYNHFKSDYVSHHPEAHTWLRWDSLLLHFHSLIRCDFSAYMNPISSSWLLSCSKWDTFPGFPILLITEQMLIRYSPLSKKESSFLWRLSMANLRPNVNILRWMHLQIDRLTEIDFLKKCLGTETHLGDLGTRPTTIISF